MIRTVIVAAFMCAPLSALACSQQDLQAKVTELTTGVQALATKNPQAAVEWSQKVSGAQASVQGAKSVDEVCAYYDKLLAELQNVK